jgi:hypothetical protein
VGEERSEDSRDKNPSSLETVVLREMEAAGIEPAPGGAKPLAESRPYLVTARNA